MVTRAQKVRLGIFLVFSAAVLLGTIALLAGIRMAEKRDVYTVRYKVSVSGLENGAQVKYNGVRVGAVDSIHINPDDVSEVIVTLSLDHGTPIKTDTRAVLNMGGITGLKNIELTLGSNATAFLKPGDEIEAGDSLMDRLTGRAEAIGQKAELLLNNANKLLDPDNRARIAGILANVEELTGGSSDLVTSVTMLLDDNRENIRAITSSLSELSAGLDSTLEHLDAEAVATLQETRAAVAKLGDTVDRAQVRTVLAGVDRLVTAARKKVRELDVTTTVSKIQGLAERTDSLMRNLDLLVIRSREDLFASLSYLLEGLENFAEFARMLRENPSLILSSPAEEER